MAGRLWAIQTNGIWARYADDRGRWDTYSEQRIAIAADPMTPEACYYIDPDGSLHWRNVDRNQNQDYPQARSGCVQVSACPEEAALYVLKNDGKFLVQWAPESSSAALAARRNAEFERDRQRRAEIESAARAKQDAEKAAREQAEQKARMEAMARAAVPGNPPPPMMGGLGAAQGMVQNFADDSESAVAASLGWRSVNPLPTIVPRQFTATICTGMTYSVDASGTVYKNREDKYVWTIDQKAVHLSYGAGRWIYVVLTNGKVMRVDDIEGRRQEAVPAAGSDVVLVAPDMTTRDLIYCLNGAGLVTRVDIAKNVATPLPGITAKALSVGG